MKQCIAASEPAGYSYIDISPERKARLRGKAEEWTRIVEKYQIRINPATEPEERKGIGMPDIYKATRFGENKPSLQGCYFGVEDIKDYIKMRDNANAAGSYRLERLWDGGWIFVQNFVIVD